ncbi:MAG TPA: glycoside hydrolase family 3 C-terminal domain-containing protein [Streptosporangiaceae bacterium]|nr:glycoside hydrolase family 3 C-terminal domain-containing protein [Streptosporangiaceae bacterium]
MKNRYDERAPRSGAGPAPALLADLPLDEKVRLLTGADNWRTAAEESLGLRPLAMSDGPAGVRGIVMDERAPSSSLPCPSALGATWDPALVAEVGAALGAEARGKNVDILLAPTVHLMRTPLGGRGFECFSEDPALTASIATAYVRGVQSAGVACAIKHFLCNESETQRWTYDVHVAGPVLRELYLMPFEACVRDGVAVVMAGYNSVNGASMTENGPLVQGVLKDEWGFAGAVVSDWHAARSTAATALAGLDLAMPGPEGPWGERLAAAVRAGFIPEELIDEKVSRLVHVARKVGDPGDGGRRADPVLLRRAAAAAFTLLRNRDDALPLEFDGPRPVRRLALIGPNAVQPVTQGGGSAAVPQASLSTPAEALRAALAGQAELAVEPGCTTWEAVPQPEPSALTDPVTGQPGTRVEFRAADGELLAAEHRTATMFTWWEGLPDGVGWGGDGRIVLRARFRATTDGPHLAGAGGVGQLTLTVDGAVAAEGRTPVPADPVEAMVRPGEIRATVPLQAGQEAELEVSLLPENWKQGPISIRLGMVSAPDENALLEAAVRAARDADAAVVVIGSGPAEESEGFDRATLALAGRQDELVRRVAAVNDRTIVVVNAGTPVLTPWADQVAALGYAWLPGQATGDALADVLLGRAEPGGRLPVTLPAAEADCPVLHAVPAGGVLRYDEGLLIGYRGFDRAGTEPQFPFGHGLGYTTWALGSLQVHEAAGGDLELTVMTRNTGTRPGRDVVQVYVAPPPGGDPGRPVRTLAGFASVTAEPGATVEARIAVPGRAFERWDEAAGGWVGPPGEYMVSAGHSSRDLPLSVPVMRG